MQQKQIYLIDGISMLYSELPTQGYILQVLTSGKVMFYSTTELGVFLCNTPAIWSLKERFQASKYSLFSSKKNKELFSQYGRFVNACTRDSDVLNYIFLIFIPRRKKNNLPIILYNCVSCGIIGAALTDSNIIILDHYDHKWPLLNKQQENYLGYLDDHIIKCKLKLIKPLGQPHIRTEFTCRSRKAVLPGQVTIGVSGDLEG